MDTPPPPLPCIVIEPAKGFGGINLRELWEYRDIIAVMVRRDFISRYKQTILGPLWFIIQPVFMTFIFTIIFSKVAQISTDGAPPSLFYMCGLMGWNWTAQSFGSASGVLLGNAALVGKVYFPRFSLVIAGTLSNVPNLVVALGVFLLYYTAQVLKAPPHVTWGISEALWLFPIALLLITLFSVGFGLWASALTIKYRDLSHALGFVTQLWMYATPIIYPLSEVPAKHLIWFYLNPISAPIELMRAGFLNTPIPNLGLCLTSAAISLLTLISGVMLFQKTERNFVDTI